MAQYIEKSAVVAEIKKRIKETESMQPKFDQFWAGQISAFKGVLKILDTLEVKEIGFDIGSPEGDKSAVKEVDLTNMKTDWCPSKKQLESLKDLLHYNIGVFNYQKCMEVNSLYEDLTKILNYETDRQSRCSSGDREKS